jgi:hypothetical protein
LSLILPMINSFVLGVTVVLLPHLNRDVLLLHLTLVVLLPEVRYDSLFFGLHYLSPC